MITEKTPSKSQYFSWINNTNEGATHAQTMCNLDFFRYLHDQYGMQLDIYAFDAGALDGKRFYGSMQSDRFKKQFPQGFGPLAEYANTIGTRLGLWGGPDGFGATPEEAQARIDTMVSLCRDYQFALFKFDGVCGELPPEHDEYFDTMMTRCREEQEDLILLNHRLALRKNIKHATTNLWNGGETYIDVLCSNETPAPHHRAGAMARGLTADNSRLIEDHGVCLSSCMEGWMDDLVLQAFGRSLILAPEIYGNPWLLKDEEFPRLARIFNLHRKYRKLLMHAVELDENQFGPGAVARGTQDVRLVVMRNLSWNSCRRTLILDERMGLDPQAPSYEIRRFYPYEFCYGNFAGKSSLEVELPPFSASLFYIGTVPCGEPGLEGTPFEVVRNVPYAPVEIDRLIPAMSRPNGRKVADFTGIGAPDPQLAASLYEATVFAADNNALEVRSLERAGVTAIPEVQAAREAFFKQKAFMHRGCWDKNLFDGNPATDFRISSRFGVNTALPHAAFRLDLGKVQQVDVIHINTGDEFGLEPLIPEEGGIAYVSEDLRSWRSVTFIDDVEFDIPVFGRMRYLKFAPTPRRIVDVSVYANGEKLDSKDFKASNLFSFNFNSVWAWSAVLTAPEEWTPDTVFAICIHGKHCREGIYAGAMLNGENLLGCPDRAISYPANTWEFRVAPAEGNTTYYLPFKKEYCNQQLEFFVLDDGQSTEQIFPELRIFSYSPWKRERVILA